MSSDRSDRLDNQFAQVATTFEKAKTNLAANGSSKWETWLSFLLRILLCLLLVGIGSLMLFWLYWPWNLLTIYGDTAVSPQNGSGGILSYTVTYCRNSPVPSTVYRTVVGVGNTHYNYPLLPVGSSVANGCGRATISVNVGVPVHPGTYYIKGDVKMPINPLRTLDYPFRTNDFKVS